MTATTTPALVMAGMRSVFAAVTPSTSNANFGAFHECEDESALQRSAPRGFRGVPVSDQPVGNSGRYTYRRLTSDWGWVYPADTDSEAIQLEDVVAIEQAALQMSQLLSQLGTPIEDTRPSVIEGGGTSFVRTDFGDGQRAITLLRLSIEYKAR